MVSRFYNVLLASANLIYFPLYYHMKSPYKNALFPFLLVCITNDLGNTRHGLRGIGGKSPMSMFFYWIYHVCIVALVPLALFGTATSRSDLILTEASAWIIFEWLIPFAFPKMNHQLYTYFAFISRFLRAYVVAGIIEATLSSSS